MRTNTDSLREIIKTSNDEDVIAKGSAILDMLDLEEDVPYLNNIQRKNITRKDQIVTSTIINISKGQTIPKESIIFLKAILESNDLEAIKQVIDPPDLAQNSSVYVSALTSALLEIGVEEVVLILKPILLKDTFFNDGSDNYAPDPVPMYNCLAAAKTLAIFGSDAVPVILKHLSEAEAFAVFTDVLLNTYDENSSVKELVKNILDEINSIVPYLITILQDSKSVDKYVAAEILGVLRYKPAVPFLLDILTSALTSKDGDMQFITTISLGEIGSSEAVPTLTKQLEYYRGHLRHDSAIALGKIGDRQATPSLIKALQQELDRQELDIRAIAFLIEALGNIYSSEDQYHLVLPYLIEFLKKESNSFIRQFAVISLGKIKAKEATPVLIESLKDKDWAVRLEAANALKSIGNEAIPHLIKILKTNQHYSSPLRVALKDKNADHRRSAAYVLWQMGSLAREAEDELVAIVEDETDNLHVRWMAAMALENMGIDMGWFFQKNNLIEPKNLTPAQCPNDIYDPEFDSESTLGIYYSMHKVDLNKIVYAGRCIYGDIPNIGGDTYGFYERIKLLLSRK